MSETHDPATPAPDLNLRANTAALRRLDESPGMRMWRSLRERWWITFLGWILLSVGLFGFIGWWSLLVLPGLFLVTRK